ncbi:lecithin retinol acyltransferase family protein [Candidatus Epulonipiscium viviparus]|uniref:lecithin retinol acyltransferase family protein n=1 Tax=Candidatus Epulonipiscium viviparus TaxID=420336 RepID=UPI00016C0F00|nr:lecithin retinol acyltransferase family protein [Candidatus Epulopiscium viviparus]
MLDFFKELQKENGFNSKIPEISRHDREELRRIGREVQKKFEETFDEVNPEFGKSVKKFNNTVNAGLDIVKKGIDNVNNSFEALHAKTWKEEILIENQIPEVGDHLWVWRLGYTHHGLYIGNGRVIHYLKEQVKEDSIETFADGSKIRIRPAEDSPAHYVAEEIVSRARSRMGENNYDLFSNNCEQFVRWCRCGAFAPENSIKDMFKEL